MPNVHIVWDDSANEMWTQLGWNIVDTLEKADLVQFTGGEDINPAFYKQHCHEFTYYNFVRDMKEYAAYKKAYNLNKPMAGICRGAQFLHAMVGGELFQDINNHHMSHEAVDTRTGEVFSTNSIHHQAVHVNKTALEKGIMVLAETRRSTYQEKMSHVDEPKKIIRWEMGEISAPDIEAYVYPDLKILGIQGHPEYLHKKLPKRYLNWIEEFIL